MSNKKGQWIIFDSNQSINEAFVEPMSVKGYYLALLIDREKEDFPFRIRGLWPQYDAGHWPQFCKEQPFDLVRLRQLLPKLHKEWHSYRGSDEHFWEHEWLKHGTCTGMNELLYFTRALECYEKCKAQGNQWVAAHFNGRTHNIPIDLDFNVGHLVF